MSHTLINRSPDLKRLRDEGFDIEVRSSHLLVKQIPYVNTSGEVKRGTLVSELTLAGDVTSQPSTHVVHFVGEFPCNRDGSVIAKIKSESRNQRLGQDIDVNHSFSSKPKGGYSNYYDKITTYIAIISHPAQSLDRGVTAKVFPVIECPEPDSVFRYCDTASSRAGISAISDKLIMNKLAIVGLGGTGSYVLDLVAKTPVTEIHLFDGDIFLNHNAFRSPGAPHIDELREKPLKAAYFRDKYSTLRRNIYAHEHFINASNVSLLHNMNFVFLCLDGGPDKRVIVEHLESWNIPFIDVGMGVQIEDGALLGALRVTTSIPGMRKHIWEKGRIPFSDGGANEYSRNIQIADLNALNAAYAVIKWKKICGFYLDLDKAHFSVYTIDGNHLLNEDCL